MAAGACGRAMTSLDDDGSHGQGASIAHTYVPEATHTHVCVCVARTNSWGGCEAGCSRGRAAGPTRDSPGRPIHATTDSPGHGSGLDLPPMRNQQHVPSIHPSSTVYQYVLLPG